MAFTQLNLAKPILDAVIECGYTHPTSIQARAIPILIAGKDLLATSQTGTGKTAAFLLPALQRLTTLEKTPHPKILVLTPTRELAMQVSNAARDYGKNLRIKVISILGGMPYRQQLRELTKPSDFIIATPGRLIDHIERGKINLSKIDIFILDEADRMLDMGFFDDIDFISTKLPDTRQTLLFTATLDERLSQLSKKVLKNPEKIEIENKAVTLENIKQQIVMAQNGDHKLKLLQHVLSQSDLNKAIIFVATKRSADELSLRLENLGYQVGALHGDMNQRKRNQTITQLRSGKIHLLVATDVASRGIDIQDITHVINFDLPRTPEDYVHRIGRTGRVGKKGTAISFSKRSDLSTLKRIEQYTKQKIEKKESGISCDPKQHSKKFQKKFDSPHQKKSHHKPKKRRF